MNWWWARENERHGPIDEATFRQMIERGEIRSDDLVWNETMATWMRASQVPGLLTPDRQAATVGYDVETLTPNWRLMELARESLSGWWGPAIGATLLYFFCFGIGSGCSFRGGACLFDSDGAHATGTLRLFSQPGTKDFAKN